MGPEVAINPRNLRLYKPDPYSFSNEDPPTTPNQWWVKRYPDAYENHGSPFMEMWEKCEFDVQVLPVTINYDFFGSVLGGRSDLGHHVVYYVPELMWYFKDGDGIFKDTTSDKLSSQYRALMMKCAEDMPANVSKPNLVHEWRSDRVCKLIIQRAKSILAASSDFFSTTSSNQRIKGPELHERLMKVLVESMLEPRPDGILTVTQAYSVFCKLSEQRSLGQLKRSMFKATMRDLVRETYGVALRNDVPDALNHQQQAWKGIRLLEGERLAA